MGDLMFWACAVALTLAINLPNGRPDARGMALILALIWAMSNVLVALYTPPESMRLFPVMDLAGGLTAYVVFRRRRAAWKILLAWLFFLQCLVHLAFWLHEAAAGFTHDPGRLGDLRAYVLALNVLFALQLACVASPGVGDAVGALLLSRRRRRPRLGAPPATG